MGLGVVSFVTKESRDGLACARVVYMEPIFFVASIESSLLLLSRPSNRNQGTHVCRPSVSRKQRHPPARELLKARGRTVDVQQPHVALLPPCSLDIRIFSLLVSTRTRAQPTRAHQKHPLPGVEVLERVLGRGFHAEARHVRPSRAANGSKRRASRVATKKAHVRTGVHFFFFNYWCLF